MAPPTTPSIDALTVFLAARLDEDEAAARAATPGAWKIRPRLEGVCIDAGEYDQVIAPGVVSCGSYCYGGTSSVDISDADAAHIARHDPARVLAEIAAKRTLITMVTGWRHHTSAEDPWYACPAATDEDGEYVCIPPGRRGDCDCGRDWRAQQVLSVLAAGFSAHPDYDLAWSVIS